MARRLRDDAAGRWPHVTNRGLSKRTMFESERDSRMFLALVAKEVRAGQIEVHAFSVTRLPTESKVFVIVFERTEPPT